MTNSLAGNRRIEYLAECRENLNLAEADLKSLRDKKVSASPDFVSELFRTFHNVNGAAARLRCDPLKSLSHLTGSVLAEALDGQMELSSRHIEVLLSSTQRMRSMVGDDDLRSDVQFAYELEQLNAILTAPRTASPVPSAPSTSSTDDPAERRLRMLVVEDDASSHVLLQGLLSRYGDCRVVVNGREAIQAFRAARQTGAGYDLICMDIQMPEMNGQEAVEQIRAIELSENIYASGVRILMTTAQREVKTILASYEARCDGYLTKPFDGKKLDEKLRSFGLITSKETSGSTMKRAPQPQKA